MAISLEQQAFHPKNWRRARWPLLSRLFAVFDGPADMLSTSANQSHSPTSSDQDTAFEQLVIRYEQRIVTFLWRMTGDEQAAYDLCQETFIRAWERFDVFCCYENQQAWLFRVATNLALNHQKRARTLVGAATPFEDEGTIQQADPALTIAEQDAVRRTLMMLTAQQRAALILQEIFGLSIQEVAQSLGITLAAAKMTIWRARERFRAHYPKGEA